MTLLEWLMSSAIGDGRAVCGSEDIDCVWHLVRMDLIVADADGRWRPTIAGHETIRNGEPIWPWGQTCAQRRQSLSMATRS